MASVERKDLAQLLVRYSVHKDADAHKLISDFCDPESGSRLFVPDEDGKVAMLVPEADGYDSPSRITVTPMSDPTRVLDEVEKSRSVTIDGVGRFGEYLLSPSRYKKALGAKEGEHTLIGLRGDLPDGFWSPLGFGGFFPEDLAVLSHLANNEGIEIRPGGELHPQVDPRDKTWKKLSTPERVALEMLLKRPVLEVVPDQLIAEALENAAMLGDGAIAGAVRSLTLAMDDEIKAAPEEKPEVAVTLAEVEAKPVLAKFFGEDLYDRTAPLPKRVLEMAEDILTERKRGNEATLVKMAIRGEDVPAEDLARAVDRAFGAGFTEKRKPTMAVIDRLIDDHGKELGEGMSALRRLRRELDYSRQSGMFGEAAVDRPLSKKTADKKMLEIYQHLRGRTGVDEAATFALASQLMSSLNVKHDRPTIIVLSGERGGGVDVVFERAKKLTESRVLDVSAAGALRGSDPIGLLVGSADFDPAAGGGFWMAPRKDGERFVASLDRLEELAGQAQGGEKDAAIKQLWSFIAELGDTGVFQGYDTKAETAVDVSLDNGIIFLRTTDTLSELREKMTPDAFAQLAPNVISFDKADAPQVIAGMSEKLRTYVMNAYGFKDANIEVDESASSFIRELMESGMKPATLERAVVENMIIPAIFYAAVDGSLGANVRLSFSPEITTKQRNQIREDWLKGQFKFIVGVGPSPFEVFDAGKFVPEEERKVSAKVVQENRVRSEIEELRAKLADYRLAADGDHKQIDALIAANKHLLAYANAAEKRVDEVSWLNSRATWEIEDLTRLNKIAQDTISTLQKDLVKANKRIDTLNADMGKMKKAHAETKDLLKTAESERNEILAALRQTENEFSQTIAGIADTQANRDPGEIFAMIVKSANQGALAHRYQKGLLHQLHNIATSRALEQAVQHARRFQKWEEITRLANGYVRASNALGVPLDGRVLEGFERAARLSGNGWDRRMADAWQRDVGVASGHKGEDPGMLSHLTRQILGGLGVRI